VPLVEKNKSGYRVWGLGYRKSFENRESGSERAAVRLVSTLGVGKLGCAKGKPSCAGGANRFAVGTHLRWKKRTRLDVGDWILDKDRV